MHAIHADADVHTNPHLKPVSEAFATGFEPPLVIAHRGFSSAYPENTLPAFEAAIDAGADMIEMDVRLTRDKRLAIVHDETLERTTDGSGPVNELSLANLLHLDAGAWFDPNFAMTPVPTLEGALRMIDRRCLINLELKIRDDSSYHEKSGLACAVLGMVRSRGLMGMTLFSSFDHGILRLIHKLEPRAHLGVLIEDYSGHAKALEIAEELNAAALHPRAGCLDSDLVEDAHRQGLLVLAWAGQGENTEAFMDSALRLGADGFFANDVLAMARAAERFRATM